MGYFAASLLFSHGRLAGWWVGMLAEELVNIRSGVSARKNC
jgi:hypothetical protein